MAYNLRLRAPGYAVVAAITLGLSLAACQTRSGAFAPQAAPAANGSPQTVSMYGDSSSQILGNAVKARAMGLTPAYLFVKTPDRRYPFSVYAQFLRSKESLIVRAFGRVYVYPLRVVAVYNGADSTRVATKTLPLVRAPRYDRLAREQMQGHFHTGDVVSKRYLCPDCIALVLQKREIRALASRWNRVRDPWQVNPTYVAWQPKVDPNDGQCPQLRKDDRGPDFSIKCPYSNGSSSWWSGPGSSGPSGSGGGSRGCGTQCSKAHKIWNEAQYMFSKHWSSKDGPSNGALACAYMVNLILQDSIGETFGSNTNYVPSVEQGLQNSPDASEEDQDQSVAGDIVIEGNEDHMGICADDGCSEVWSNSSSNGCFCWESGPGFGQSGLGDPPSTFWHVGP